MSVNNYSGHYELNLIDKHFSHEAHEIKSINEFKDFMKTKVRILINYDMAVCGIGDIKSRRVIRLINIDFPNSYLRHAVQPNQSIQSPIVHKWLGSQDPIVFYTENVTEDMDQKWLKIIKESKIRTISSHGLLDPCNQSFSYFGFANTGYVNADIMRFKLIELIPYLHYALTRVLTLSHNTTNVPEYISDTDSFDKVLLSEKYEKISLVTMRELEILNWISLGKRNEDIAQILSISKHTVSNHIKSIFKKLDVTSRAQAISKAATLSQINTHQASKLRNCYS